MAFLPQLCSQQQGMMETLCNTFISDNLPHLLNHFVISQLVNNFLDPASICQTLRACHRPDQLSESVLAPGSFPNTSYPISNHETFIFYFFYFLVSQRQKIMNDAAAVWSQFRYI